MKQRVLKSLLGKFICSIVQVNYCHVDRVIKIGNGKAIATAIIKTPDGRTLHWILFAGWTTDHLGKHEIIDYELLREDEIDGNYTQEDEAVQ